MLRKLKHHEKKLLKKTDFLDWKKQNNQRQLAVMVRLGKAVLGWRVHIDVRQRIERIVVRIAGVTQRRAPIRDRVKPRDAEDGPVVDERQGLRHILDHLGRTQVTVTAERLTVADGNRRLPGVGTRRVRRAAVSVRDA